MLVVLVAELALRGSRLGAQPLGGGLAHPEREAREGQPAEQVVEVAVGGEQPIGLEAGLRKQRGSASSSSGKYGESISIASSPARSAVAVVCHIRLVTTSASRWTETARRPEPRLGGLQQLAGVAEGLDLRVGLLRAGSISSPWRLTQITGIFSLMQGSMSVG